MGWKKNVGVVAAVVAIAVLIGFALGVWIPWCTVGNGSCKLGAAEWAYWAQAIGSISAILGAAWIASDQYRKQIRDRKLSNTLQASICCDSAESTYTEVLALLNETSKGEDIVSTRTKILIFLQRSFAAHVSDMGAVSVGDLSYEDAVVFAQARRLCRIMEHVIGIILIEPPNSNLGQITEILNERAPFAKAQAVFLRASHHKMSDRGSKSPAI